MRRTTIFRSELTCAALLAAVSAVAGAQQPAAPPAQQPVTRVVVSSPSDATQTQGQSPATHTVREGDTLWALAQQYLGDPLLWPEIYRLNTNVVEDPHWIYPGEELRITPDASSGTVTPSADTAVVAQDLTVTPSAVDSQPSDQQQQAQPAPTTGPTIFSTMGVQRRATTLQVAGARAYRAVREGEYYSAGFLTENQQLNSGRIIANASTSSRGAIRTRTSTQIFEDVIVDPPPGEPLQTGDLLLSFRRGTEVEQYGEMILPTGLLRVKNQNGPTWVANAFRVFNPIMDGQEVIKVQPFVNTSSARAEPVTSGVRGTVLAVRDKNEVAQIQDLLFLDQGANSGLRLGDIVQIYAMQPDSADGHNVEQDQGRAIIVNTRSNTSTALIVELYRGDVGAQSRFRQVRRMPS